MLWVDKICADAEMLESFLGDLAQMRENALREMEQATTWAEFVEARGRKRTFDMIERRITIQQKEEQDYVTYVETVVRDQRRI